MGWHEEFMAKAKKGAEAGDPEQMFNYGTSFGNDSKKALPWLEKSAAAGWGPAMSTLGGAWTNGSYGAGVDIPKGIAFFEQAIAAGQTSWAGQPLIKHLQKAKLKLKKSGGKPRNPVDAAFEHGDIMWGDAGKLFWWITPADLKASRFGRARLTVHF